MTDDILIHGKGRSEHHRNLMAVLEYLEESGLTLNLNKCEFYMDEITFFGLRFTKDGISPTEDRCRALREVKEPTNVKELRSFLCMALWSSRFIKNICIISERLWNLVRKDQIWKWGPNLSLMEVEVDAGPSGIGAVLVQYNPNDRNDRIIINFK